MASAAPSDNADMLAAIKKIMADRASSNEWTWEKIDAAVKKYDARLCMTAFNTTQYRSDAEIAKPVVFIGTPDGKAVTPTGKLVDNPIEAMVSDGFVNNIKGKMMVTINWLRGFGLDGAAEQIRDPQRKDPDPLRAEAKLGVSKDSDGRYEDQLLNFLYAAHDHLIEGVKSGKPLAGFKRPQDYAAKAKALKKKMTKGGVDTDELAEALQDSTQPPYTFMRFPSADSKYAGSMPTLFLRGPIFPRMTKRDERAGTVGPDGVHKPSLARVESVDHEVIRDALRQRPREPKGDSGHKLNNYALHDVNGKPINMSAVGAGSIAIVPFEIVAKATPAGAPSLQLSLIDDTPIQVVHLVEKTEAVDSGATDYMAAIAAATKRPAEDEAGGHDEKRERTE